MDLPEKLKYTESHEWIADHGDGTVTVGITAVAAEQLGDLVYVELPKVGTRVARGANCAVVESTKAASEVYAPVSGEIVAANAELAQQPRAGQRVALRQRLAVQDQARGHRPSSASCSRATPTPSRRACEERSRSPQQGRVRRPASRQRRGGAAADARDPQGRLARRAGARGGAGRHPAEGAACARRGDARAGGAGATERARHAQRGLAQLHRHGLPRHAHAGGDPAQRAREPRLVHRVHALPGRDLAGTPGGAAQFPADGDRPYRAAGGERIAPRRSHGRGRGDGDDPAQRQEQGGGVFRRQRVPPAGPRRDAHARASGSASSSIVRR